MFILTLLLGMAQAFKPAIGCQIKKRKKKRIDLTLRCDQI